jgi:hypothetical protein
MEISSIDEYLNLIHTLLSVEYSDDDIFEIYPVKQWSRECLCFDLLVRMEMNKKTNRSLRVLPRSIKIRRIKRL